MTGVQTCALPIFEPLLLVLGDRLPRGRRAALASVLQDFGDAVGDAGESPETDASAEGAANHGAQATRPRALQP